MLCLSENNITNWLILFFSHSTSSSSSLISHLKLIIIWIERNRACSFYLSETHLSSESHKWNLRKIFELNMIDFIDWRPFGTWWNQYVNITIKPCNDRQKKTVAKVRTYQFNQTQAFIRMPEYFWYKLISFNKINKSNDLDFGFLFSSFQILLNFFYSAIGLTELETL